MHRIHRVASDQIRDCEVQEDTDADMEVIKHRIDLNQSVFSVCDGADSISLQFGFVLFWDERLSRLGEKDDIYVELRVDIWNRGGNFRRELNMSLRWSAEDWTHHDSIDIALLWSARQNQTFD